MQRENELSTPVNDTGSLLFQPIADGVAAGDYCSTTHRIVVISPLPYSLHLLVRELTAKCYDVLVFRHLDDEALGALPIDLMIIDLTQETELETAAKALSRFQGVPALRLVRPEKLAGLAGDEQGSFAAATLMNWKTSTLEQVLERVHKLLQQGTRQNGQRNEQWQLKDLMVDGNRIAVYRGTDRIEVTKTEFDLLKSLLDAGGAALSRQQLMDRVWGEHYFGGSNTVDVHVKSLRQKLGDDPKKPKYIATIRGVGYRIAD
ncbi:winged helix-turn-helix transcriptional regulator [Paenibacillus piri]|uniref:Winged-helix domain-containing protein n=1 Tax=Paenibacillus piri TaxID=2547395 RepID=A0A4R5KBA7_9BACL|nr:winged-helix domain-containing protein [Paenibacillus piri]TDF92316.1 winged-helix domain-containing protein [Paenibacillus piri]